MMPTMNDQQQTNQTEPVHDASPAASQTGYRVELETFDGPLDLLLYLIRKEEVDIYDIPLARITKHYLKHLDMMVDLDVNIAGEFIVMAATLLEIKARMMAPEPVGDGEEEELEDPRLELVRQLMEYRRFKEASLTLTERARMRGQRFNRPGDRINEAGRHKIGVPKNVSLEQLMGAFSRVLEQTGARGPLTIRMDLIPQEQLNVELAAKVEAAGRIAFFCVFADHTDRVILVGMFFAILELARQQVISLAQDEPFGEIWLDFVSPAERNGPDNPSPVPEVAATGDAPELRGEPDSAYWTPEELAEGLPEVEELEGEGVKPEN
jgi:segregation and condensation protein A